MGNSGLKDHLLVHFSVVSLVMMVILAVVVSMILTGKLNDTLALLTDHGATMEAGRIIKATDPFSISSLRKEVASLRWITYGAVGAGFVILYATLVSIVWRGSRTIASQRSHIESVNAELAQRGEELRASNEELLVDINDRKRAEKALRDSERRIRELAESSLRAHEEERRWAALEVHDRISQTLVGLAHYIQAIDSMTSPNCDAKHLTKRAYELVREAIVECRNIMNDLYPDGLDEFGIVRLIEVAVERFEEAGKCQASFHHSDVPTLDNGVATTLYRIFQEALANVGSHAAADDVAVSLTCEGEAVSLEVTDNGSGFEPEEVVSRVGGLMSMRRRAEVIGGSFSLRSIPGHGTTVTALIPIES